MAIRWRTRMARRSSGWGTPSGTASSGRMRRTGRSTSATRRAQGFSVIQFFSTHWRALATDPDGQPSYSEDGRFTVNPAFYQRLDPKVEAIARHGLLASAIVVLSLYDEEPGWAWPEEQLIRFARWLRARWGAYHVAWSLGGDGDFRGERAERWKRIGPAVYSRSTGAPGHDASQGLELGRRRVPRSVLADVLHLPELPFRRGAEGALAAGGTAHVDWRQHPPRPIVNIEPNYEDHPSYASGIRFSDREVRRAAYWSLLVTPTAGVSYGHYSLWAWASRARAGRGGYPLPGGRRARTVVDRARHAGRAEHDDRQALLRDRRLVAATPGAGSAG